MAILQVPARRSISRDNESLRRDSGQSGKAVVFVGDTLGVVITA